MDVVLPLVVLSIPFLVLLWFGVRWAWRHDRKHRRKPKPDQGLIDAAFEVIVRNEWKRDA